MSKTFSKPSRILAPCFGGITNIRAHDDSVSVFHTMADCPNCGARLPLLKVTRPQRMVWDSKGNDVDVVEFKIMMHLLPFRKLD
jgi:hypothetical protein